MQIPDQRPDAIGGLLLGLPDLVELIADRRDVVLLEELPRDVDLDREPEQDLGEVVVQVPGDLEALVGPLLRHRVREGLEHLLPLLQLGMRLLQRLRPEEHLPREDKRCDDRWQDPPTHSVEHHRQGQSENTEPQVTDDELPQTPNPELTRNALGERPSLILMKIVTMPLLIT